MNSKSIIIVVVVFILVYSQADKECLRWQKDYIYGRWTIYCYNMDLSDSERKLIEDRRRVIQSVIDSPQLTVDQLVTTKSLDILKTVLEEVKRQHQKAQSDMHWNEDSSMWNDDSKEEWHQGYQNLKRLGPQWDILEQAIAQIEHANSDSGKQN